MSISQAWLLECGNSLSIAIGDHEMAEFVQQQNYFSVPGSPGYCSSVIVWQGNIVPVMDVAALLGAGTTDGRDNPLLCVLNYQAEPNTPLKHLAVRVSASPRKIVVDDEHACEIPDALESSLLGSVGLACFNYDELPVLIVDIARLCSAEFRELANAA